MIQFDFSSDSFKKDPLTYFDIAPRDKKIVPAKIKGIGQCYLVQQRDALIDLLKSPHRFTTNFEEMERKDINPLLGKIPSPKLPRSTLFHRQGKEQKYLRADIDLAFRKLGIESYRPLMAKIADTHIETLTNQSRLDLVTHFARPMTADILFSLIGFPQKDFPELTKRLNKITQPGEFFGPARMTSSAKYIRKAIETLLATHGNDEKTLDIHPTLSTLLRESFANSSVNFIHEAADTLMEILLSSYLSTANLISLGSLTLFEHPEQLTTLRQDWTLISKAVDEILRHASPVQTTGARYALNAFDFHGQTLSRGDIVIGLLFCANMDTTTHSAPEKFDISRIANGHMSFGSGLHFCLGAQLAHTIAEITLQRIFTRWTALKVETSKLKWANKIGVREIKNMPIQAG